MLKLFFQNRFIEAGCDEAGRGCLAGPVFAAAVILPKDMDKKILKHLDDSKKMKESTRYELRPIIEKVALAYAVAFVDHKEIDEINILNASFLAMHRAIAKLKLKPGSLLIDGNRFKKYPDIPHHCIIKGDGKFLSIAAASVLAKTYRDDFMKEAAKAHPHYGWERNMGYPTRQHREAIRVHATTPLHRMTFQLLPGQLEMELTMEE